MQRWVRLGLGALGCAALLVPACGLDAVGKLDDSSVDASAPRGDASLPPPPESDAQRCVPEVCGDGIDNDCNGKTDCEDVACGASACAPLPEGWAYLAQVTGLGADGGTPTPDAGLADAGASGSCPAGWTSPTLMVEGPKADATTCKCTCGDGANPCTHDTLAASFRTGVSVCNDGNATLTADGACHARGFNWNNQYNAMGANVLAPKNGTCPATVTLPQLTFDSAVTTCSLGPAAGASCACKPAGATVCVKHDGDVECPAGYGAKHLLYARSGIVDGRTCAACTCATAATTCSAAKVVFATDAACTANLKNATIDGTCTDLPAGLGTPAFYKYSATPDVAGCAPSTATPALSGALTLPSASTVCCP